MNFIQCLGIIALDIDGTITVDHHPIAPDVIAFMTKLHAEGWQFMFLTGRTFSWGYEVLKELPFPFTFAAQNGAIVLEMPSRAIVSRKYLTKKVIPVMEQICQDEPTDFVIYTGFENKDLCYYRSSHFDEELAHYLAERSQRMNETWVDIPSFDVMPVEEFSSVKCFGGYASTARIAQRIDSRLGLHIPLIRDPYRHDHFVAQATHPEADKGLALSELLRRYPNGTRVIAAGDDLNDIAMMKVASCKVVMETAPPELLGMADVIAPPAKALGIIDGLTHAIEGKDKD